MSIEVPSIAGFAGTGLSGTGLSGTRLSGAGLARPDLPSVGQTELGAARDALKSGEPDALRRASEAFEVAFLSEMLRHSGVGATPEGFGGGPGEDAFSGFLLREYATEIAKSGKLGIAEQVFASLSEAQPQDGDEA
ncbi:MAG: rod-binding protein [Pseudomonadota bacterium]